MMATSCPIRALPRFEPTVACPTLASRSLCSRISCYPARPGYPGYPGCSGDPGYQQPRSLTVYPTPSCRIPIDACVLRPWMLGRLDPRLEKKRRTRSLRRRSLMQIPPRREAGHGDGEPSVVLQLNIQLPPTPTTKIRRTSGLRRSKWGLPRG